MKKKLIFFLVLSMIFSMASGITENEITKGDYICGFAEGKKQDIAELDKRALEDLSSQISVNVEHEYEGIVRENNGEVDEDSKKYIKVFSNNILYGATREIVKISSSKIKVYRYIKKESLKLVFEGRKNKVIQKIENGKLYEERNEIGDALESYYWALILLKSLPNKNDIKYGGEFVLGHLEYKIKSLLNDVKIVITKKNKPDDGRMYINLAVNNKKGPIENLNIKYDDENSWLESNVKGGVCVVSISEDYYECMDKLKFTIDYENKDKLGDIPQDEDVKNLLESFTTVPFDNAKEVSKDKVEMVKGDFVANKIEMRAEANMLDEILNSIKVKDFAPIKHYFTDEGFAQFMKIMKYGDVKLFDGKHEIEMFSYGKNKQIRSIPLVFKIKTYKSGLSEKYKLIYDNIVLILDENEKVSWANFTISDKAFRETVRKGKVVTDFKPQDLEERMLGINFMEYYKTLFNLKDADRIENLFRDDAKIFVGYVKKSEPLSKDLENTIRRNMGEQEVEYRQCGKRDYINSLKQKTFKSPYVNIQFTGMDIANISDREKAIYAIQMKQDFYSTYYSDCGYLLLFADYMDKDNPKIFYRYWAPKVVEKEKIDKIVQRHNF